MTCWLYELHNCIFLNGKSVCTLGNSKETKNDFLKNQIIILFFLHFYSSRKIIPASNHAGEITRKLILNLNLWIDNSGAAISILNETDDSDLVR
jgi:hypothetical protein